MRSMARKSGVSCNPLLLFLGEGEAGANVSSFGHLESMFCLTGGSKAKVRGGRGGYDFTCTLSGAST